MKTPAFSWTFFCGSCIILCDSMLKETFKSSLANSHSASVKLLAIHYLSLMHCTSFLTREIRLSAVIVMMMYCCHRNKSILVSLPIKFLNSQLLKASERSFSKLINGRESCFVFLTQLLQRSQEGNFPSFLPSPGVYFLGSLVSGL